MVYLYRFLKNIILAESIHFSCLVRQKIPLQFFSTRVEVKSRRGVLDFKELHILLSTFSCQNDFIRMYNIISNVSDSVERKLRYWHVLKNNKQNMMVQLYFAYNKFISTEHSV